MIDMSLVRRKIVRDVRGKIKSGKKSDKGFPMKLDHFNIEKFQELREAYGDKPKRLIIFFPSNEIAENMKFDFIKYGRSAAEGAKGTATRICDGKRCVFRVETEIKGKKYGRGEECPCVCDSLDANDEREKKQMCKADVRFYAWIFCPNIGDIDNPVTYEFETHSATSGNNVLSHMMEVKAMFGQLVGIPFVVAVNMATKADDPKSTYPVWNLQVFGRKSQIVKQLAAVKESGGAFFTLPPMSPEEDNFKEDQGTMELETTDPDDESAAPAETVSAVKQRERDLFAAIPGPQPEATAGSGALAAMIEELNKLENSKPIIVGWKQRHEKAIAELTELDRKEFFATFNKRLETALPF